MRSREVQGMESSRQLFLAQGHWVSLNCSTAEEGYRVSERFTFLVSSLYVLTTFICRPKIANQLSELSALLSPLTNSLALSNP